MRPMKTQKKSRFLNMEEEQVTKRKKRFAKQKQRRNLKKTKADPKMQKKRQVYRISTGTVTEHSERQRKLRPCCGLRVEQCQCKPPAGFLQRPLNELAKHYATTPLSTVWDTTDVVYFRKHMRQPCQSLPLWVQLSYSYVHVMFNQEHLLKAMLQEKVFLFKSPWMDWVKLATVINKAKKQTGDSIFELLQRHVERHRATSWLYREQKTCRRYRARRFSMPVGRSRLHSAVCLRPLRRISKQRPLEGIAS